MLQKVLTLTPSAIKTAKDKLADYIRQAKSLDIMKDHNAPSWDNATWDISSLTKRPSEASKNALLQFRPVGERGRGGNQNEPYPDEIGDILKADMATYLDETYGTGKQKSNVTVVGNLLAIRNLIDALISEHSLECITEVQLWQIEDYLKTLKSQAKYSKVKSFLKGLINAGILPQLEMIAFKAPSRKKRYGEASASRRAPSTWDEIVAIGTAFYRSAYDKDQDKVRACVRFHTSLATLLCTTPSRKAELWRLPNNCEIVNNPADAFGPNYAPLLHEDKSFKYGLRWWPAKGGRPIVKFVPTPMVEVAKRAFEIIREYTDEPRKLAKWIIDNPEQLPIPDEYPDIKKCRETGVISNEQIKRLFGYDGEKLSQFERWKIYYKKTKATENRKSVGLYLYDFKTFERDWWIDFKRNFPSWPMVVDDGELELRADKALLVCFQGELSKTTVNKSKIFLEIPNLQAFEFSLSGKNKSTESIFETLDIKLPDGTYPSIQTHDPRHFLNTMAQRAGVPQKIIAAWSGRLDVTQNADYNHMTTQERRAAWFDSLSPLELQNDLLAKDMSVFTGEIAPPSTELLSKQQVSFREVQKNLYISWTEFGYCLGNLHEEPCPSALGCASCSRFMTCKGSEKSKVYMEGVLEKFYAQKRTLEEAKEQGRANVSESHLAHANARYEGQRAYVEAMNNPNLPDETLIFRKNFAGAQTLSQSNHTTELRQEYQALTAEKREIPNG